MIERISPAGAPAPRGPYSPAVQGGRLHLRGRARFRSTRSRGKVITGDVQAETRQVLTNIKNILAGCGASMEDVVRCGVYLTNADDFQAMNEVYAEFFGVAKPARSTIVVASLPLKDAKIEIDAIAYKP